MTTCETFWVIERFENGQSQGYWYGEGSRQFSKDIDVAIQFRRKSDAVKIRRAWHWKDCEVTEHLEMR